VPRASADRARIWHSSCGRNLTVRRAPPRRRPHRPGSPDLQSHRSVNASPQLSSHSTNCWIQRHRGRRRCETAHGEIRRVSAGPRLRDCPGYHPGRHRGHEEIKKTLYEALALVIIVVFLFLQGWRATLIHAGVPVSLVGTCSVPLFGFSINTLSLFGLVLASGWCGRRHCGGRSVEHHIDTECHPGCTFKAMEEVSGRSSPSPLSLRRFLCRRVHPGITAAVQQFAVTIAVSLVISAFNALTLSPALARCCCGEKGGTRPWASFSPVHKVFDRATRAMSTCGC